MLRFGILDVGECARALDDVVSRQCHVVSLSIGAGAAGQSKNASPRISTLALVGVPGGQVGSVNAV